ncbi:MAG: hypothetical protein K6A39_08950 [Clostridiales bacterium]|nr:hypothetical protein [Clostridiales bacterium]
MLYPVTINPFAGISGSSVLQGGRVMIPDRDTKDPRNGPKHDDRAEERKKDG